MSTGRQSAALPARLFSAIHARSAMALLADAVNEWNVHNAPRLGAALAFYTLLSLTPLLIVLVALSGSIFTQRVAEVEIIQQVRSITGSNAASALVRAVLEGSRNTNHGFIAGVVALGTLLFGSSAVLVELRDALNTMWDVPPTGLTGMRKILGILRERLFSFAVVGSIALLLMALMTVNASFHAYSLLFGRALGKPGPVLSAAMSVLSFVGFVILFAATFRIMPDVHIQWRDAIPGATVTTLLFVIGKALLAVYLRRAAFVSTYGAASSVAVLLIWVYYSSQIFFFGAAFTKVLSQRYGSRRARPGISPRPA
jgi:membrane protein